MKSNSTCFGSESEPDSGSFTISEPLPKIIRSVNKYELEEEVGHGGTSTVFAARDLELQRRVAIKLLNPALKDRPEVVQRFVNEAFAMCALQHPGIAHVYECGFTECGLPFTVMKLIEGLSLSSLLKKRQESNLPVSALLKIFSHVCDAMAYTHSQKILHLDLKPANIMVGAFGECRIMDWGLARATTTVYDEETPELDSPSIRTRGVHGTPMYMAPEQSSAGVVDMRTDVFGLGAILCKVLTGHPPYSGTNRKEVLEKVSLGDISHGLHHLKQCREDPELVKLSLQCIQPSPDDRPDDAYEVAKRTAKLVG